ncbi:hypothetical protein NQZ68_013828 [Dissostichus eleginoides]|nr:hypothetical protein NQZ68_013828 [Dissostichus eleginoides]
MRQLPPLYLRVMMLRTVTLVNSDRRTEERSGINGGQITVPLNLKGSPINSAASHDGQQVLKSGGQSED